MNYGMGIVKIVLSLYTLGRGYKLHKVMIQTRCPKCGQKMEIEVYVDEQKPQSVWNKISYEICLK